MAEILQSSQVIYSKKSSSLFLPDDFMDIKELDLCYCGNLDGLLDLALLKYKFLRKYCLNNSIFLNILKSDSD